MLLRSGRLAWRFGQGCFLAKTGPRVSRKYVRRWRGPRARRRSSGVGCPCPRLGSGEAWSSPSNGPITDLIAPIRPLQLYADGGYQLRIRRLEGTPNYGPRHISTTDNNKGGEWSSNHWKESKISLFKHKIKSPFGSFSVRLVVTTK
jgi:hypothetical protein